MLLNFRGQMGGALVEVLWQYASMELITAWHWNVYKCSTILRVSFQATLLTWLTMTQLGRKQLSTSNQVVLFRRHENGDEATKASFWINQKSKLFGRLFEKPKLSSSDWFSQNRLLIFKSADPKFLQLLTRNGKYLKICFWSRKASIIL